jgi:hypothetical protein
VAEALGLRSAGGPVLGGPPKTATTPELPDLPQEEPDGQPTSVL